VNRSSTKLAIQVARAFRVAPLVILPLLAPGSALAEYFGLIHGRSSSGNDISYFGVRFNSRVAPRLVVFGDAGTSEFGNADGMAFGLGMTFELTNQRILLPSLDIAFKGAYHVANFNLANQTFNVEGFSIDLLVSGIATEGVGGYANFGYHHLEFELGGAQRTSELGFGAGLLVPIGPGEAYAGFEFIDEVTLGAGYRYFIQERQASTVETTLKDNPEDS